MKKLQEIISILSRKRIKKIEVFNEGSGHTSKDNLYYKLYQGIRSGKYKTDEEAALALCNSKPSSKKYLMLKSRVKTRLLNNLFFLENKNNPFAEVLYRSNRDLFSGKILLQNGAYRVGFSLLKSTLREAKKYQFTEVVLEALRVLRYQCSFWGLQKEFEEYNEELNHFMRMFQAETKAEEYFGSIGVHFAKSSAPKPHLIPLLKQYIEKVKALNVEFGSITLRLSLYRLQIAYHSISLEYEEMVKYCEDAEKFLERNDHLASRVRIMEFSMRKMVGYMYLKDYNSAVKSSKKSLKLLTKGSYNWMTFLEYYFVLAMHTYNYVKAREILEEVVTHERFKNVEDSRQERWRIFDAYLKYILEGDSPEQQQQLLSGKFKMYKFLNEVPNYSKDKSGLNVSILILQILFMLERRDFDGIIDRVDSLKVYVSRYLKAEVNFRSNCFMKMLLIMEKKNFNFEDTQRIANKYLKKLEDSSFNYEGSDRSELEIIPYEDLWSIMLSKLKLVA